MLQAGHTDYVVNAAALDSMRGHGLSGQVVALLDAHPAKLFTDASAWAAYLARLGIDQLAVTPDPVQIATEGALWGAICHHGLLAEAVIVFDGTSQFRVGTHALCWVHAERLMHKLVPATPEQRRAVEVTRTPACCTEVACGTAGWADVRSLLPDLTLEAHLAFQAEPRPLSPIPATEAQGHQLGSLRRGPAPARKPHGVVHGRGDRGLAGRAAYHPRRSALVLAPCHPNSAHLVRGVRVLQHSGGSPFGLIRRLGAGHALQRLLPINGPNPKHHSYKLTANGATLYYRPTRLQAPTDEHRSSFVHESERAAEP